MMKLLPIRAKQVQHNANVFISKDESKAIIVSLHFNGKSGFLVEDSEPVVLTSPIDPNALGVTLLSALRKTSINKPGNFRNRKLTDWPAFKASKAPSVRQFELNYIPLFVSGTNDVNLIYTIEGFPFKDAELHIYSSISSSMPANKLGERIMMVFRACRDRSI